VRNSQQLNITLSPEMAEMVRAKVESGEYSSASEVIHEGLRSLQKEDSAIAAWLRDEVAPVYEAMKADPTLVVSAEQMQATLAAAYKAALRAG